MTSGTSRTSPKFFLQRTRTGRRGVLIFIACTLTLLSTAWELQAQPTDLKFEHLTVEQGLPFNRATVIMQDSRGFIWFGANGLNKYDGNSLTTYKADILDSASLSGPWVSILYEDRHGDLWIVAGGQLNRYDRVTGRIARHLPDRHPTSICEDTYAGEGRDGMWVTTFGQGTYCYDRSSGRFMEYRHNPKDPYSIGSDSTFCAFVDVAGTLWIGTANGLNSLDKSSRQLQETSRSFQN